MLEVVTRSDGETDYTFVLNHGTEPLAVTTPQDSVDLLGATGADGVLTLPRYGVAVLASARTGAVPFIGRA